MAVTGLSLVPITDVSEAPIVVHGTYKEVLPIIEQQVSTFIDSFSNSLKMIVSPRERTLSLKHCRDFLR